MVLTSKRLVGVDVGCRTLEMEQRVVHQVSRRLGPCCVPLILTDDLNDYATALLNHFGHWRQPPRRPDKGPTPKPGRMPLPARVNARSGDIVRLLRSSVNHEWCSAPGWGSSRCWRDTAGPSVPRLSKGGSWKWASSSPRSVAGSTRFARAKRACRLGWSCSRCTAICLPHARLRQRLHAPGLKRHRRSQRESRTPGMGAGPTDHVWTLREVLLFWVPPWPRPAEGSRTCWLRIITAALL